jgi:hypothetical protein
MKTAMAWLGVTIGLMASVGYEELVREEEAPSPEVSSATEEINIGGACRAVQGDHVGVFNAATATWTLSQKRPGWTESVPADISFVYGNANANPPDVPLMGDWDGNGTQTQGVWRPSTGEFFLANTLGGVANLSFTIAGSYMPLVGDWDGNKTTTVGTYSAGTWRLRNSNAGDPTPEVVFNYGGTPGEIPLSGDWDGDGTWTPGVYRAPTGEFHLRNSNTTGVADVVVHFGPVGGNDTPITGDWNGDGVTTVGLRHGAQFQLSNSNTPSPPKEVLYTYGASTAKPVTGNWGSSSPAYPTTPSSLTNFFPLAIDWQAPGELAGWTAEAINTAIRVKDGTDIGAWTTAANAAGLRMIREPRANPDADDGETGLLAWLLEDEPESRGLLATLQTQYQDLKTHNSRPVFFNFAGSMILPFVDKNIQCNGPGDGTGETCYPSYINTEDWVSQDIYPVAGGDPSLYRLPWVIEKLRRWAGAKPAFAYIETADVYSNDGRPAPTPTQLRGEIWSAIVHGVRGIFYFPFGHCETGCVNETPAANRQEMRAQNIRISSLATVLQTAINPSSLGMVAPTPLDAAWRSYGSYRYFFVLNFSASPVTKTMRVCGITPSVPITVLGENRTVGSAGSGTFSDTFAPLETHIYRISTAGSPPTTGLLGWWKLNEGSGSTAADATTSSSNGTLLGSPTWTTGKVNGALLFNGSTSRVDIGNPSELQLTGAMTLSAWVYINSFATNGRIVNKQGSSSQRGWSLNVESSGVASMQVASNATTLVSVNSGPLPTNKWVHLTGTYAPGAALRIYVDGALAGEKTTGVPASQYNSTVNVQIGRRPDGPGAWDGKLDEVRVYNRVLTLSEIQAVAQ